MPVLINPYRFADPASGGFLPPAIGTVSTFSNSLISGANRTYVATHSHTNGGILLCAAFKGSTDAGPPTYTIDQALYNATSLTEIGRSSNNIFGSQPTVIAFFAPSIATTTGGFTLEITASTGDIQCIGMVGIDLSDTDGVGAGLDSDGDTVSGTTQEITVTTAQANSRVFGITAPRGDNNDPTITTPSGYAEHAQFGTDFSSTTDIAMAVHSIIVPTAGAQAYATSWDNSAAWGSLGFEIEGTAA